MKICKLCSKSHSRKKSIFCSSVCCVKQWKLNNMDRIKHNNKTWYQNNKQYADDKHTEWNRNNIEHLQQNKQQYYIDHRVDLQERQRQWKKDNINYQYNWRQQNPTYARNWCDNNRSKCNANRAKYRAKKLHATPNWLTEKHLQQIYEFYKKARELTQLTGIKYEVDHIEPLQGKNVSGLHVPWNLQILTKAENLKKGRQIAGKKGNPLSV